MSMLAALVTSIPNDGVAAARAALVKSLDMGSLWQSCSDLVSRALPCHSCSLLFDIDGHRPHQGHHHLSETGDDGAHLVTSLDVAAPYLDANPQIPWYTFSQIVSQDVHAAERLRLQNPTPGWREFIHLAFWNGTRLDAVLSIRIHTEHDQLSEHQRSFLMELYPLLDASLQRVRSLESSQARQRLLEALLYELPLAAILVDEDLLPSYMSLEAKRICRRWSEDAERSGHLPRAIEAPLLQWMRTVPARSEQPASKASFTVEHPHRPGLRLRLDASPAPENFIRHKHHLLILTPEGDDQLALDSTSSRALPQLKCLSPSERKVAMLVAAGLSNDAIAQKLCRSRKTIESQISSIFRKLNVGNRTQVATLLS